MLEEDEQDSISHKPEGSVFRAHSAPAEVRAGNEARTAGELGEAYSEAAEQDCEPQEEEPAPMIDVHPPHEGIHTWKTYLLHMSTIVLGLLIAIGLEQSVEALHRAHEREELRASLNRDSAKIITDAMQAEKAQTAPVLWLQGRQRQVRDALIAHRSLAAPLPRIPYYSSAVPINPAWNAAKSSGLISLLTQPEVQAYSELDSIFAQKQIAYDAGIDAAKKLAQFEGRYVEPQNEGVMDMSSATPAELNQYLDLLSEEATAWSYYGFVCGFLRGGETAVLAGERDLGKIQKAELQFFSPPY